MENVILLRYTEITLKGKNRSFFEDMLINNIRKTLQRKEISFSYIKKARGRVLVGFEGEKDPKTAFPLLERVFGVQSLSKALLVKPEIEYIKMASSKILEGCDFQTFRVSAKRGDKSFSKTSNDVERELGAFVGERFGKKVDLKKYDMEIKVEIFNGVATVSAQTVFGPGGLPVGCGGVVFVGSDYANYLSAAYYMMKRGCKAVFYGGKKPRENILEGYNVGLPVSYLERKVETKEDLLGTMKKNRTQAFVVGLGVEDFFKTKEDFPKDCLFLGPLIGFDKSYVENLEKFLAGEKN